jgi:hypothetical protein
MHFIRATPGFVLTYYINTKTGVVNGVSKALFETPCTSLGLLLVLY